ncbi:MAG: Uma2 family endonuclease [Oscillatoriales cyanobacterium C42_A2020_001]|nr:Uma2 family endonuclease [Leptolyngbyaceae cyanobacterium C42_A2020_001]
MVHLALQQISVPPGQHVLLRDVSWQEFEAILQELGDRRGSRVAYEKGVLEIWMPLPEHEFDKEIIGDLLKALLEELDIEFLTLGSTTFKNKELSVGLEPDQCFYIQNEPRIRGKKRLDLAVDPPPDLALEIDITSRTHPTIYRALGVPELWRFERGQLQINILQNGEYVEVSDSPTFPDLPLNSILLQYLEESRTVGRNTVMKAFRRWVRESIKSDG